MVTGQDGSELNPSVLQFLDNFDWFIDNLYILMLDLTFKQSDLIRHFITLYK